MFNKVIFRDDDCGADTKLERFIEVHNLFKKYKVIHTIALICKDLEKNQPLIDYINENKSEFDIQVHCWEHYDFTQNASQLMIDLPKCIDVIEGNFNVTPTMLFCPWNKSDELTKIAALKSGLRVNNKKISLSQYLKGAKSFVINFHSWSDECDQLEEALIKYKKQILNGTP